MTARSGRDVPWGLGREAHGEKWWIWPRSHCEAVCEKLRTDPSYLGSTSALVYVAFGDKSAHLVVDAAAKKGGPALVSVMLKKE